MKVTVSEELCSGHGRCYALAPEVYSADDEGYNVARGRTLHVPEELAPRAARGARGCPERAITVTEAGPSGQDTTP
jgi:ferredoxin